MKIKQCNGAQYNLAPIPDQEDHKFEASQGYLVSKTTMEGEKKKNGGER